MNTPAAAVHEKLVEGLTGALDQELALLERRSGEMEQLREAIARTDDGTMELLLERMAASDREQSQVDAQVARWRAAVSAAVAPGQPVLRLSRLVEYLPEEPWRQVERRRTAILRGIAQLRRRQMEAAVLLTECARINRLLLEALLGAKRSVVTYDARGGHHCQRESGLLSTEL